MKQPEKSTLKNQLLPLAVAMAGTQFIMVLSTFLSLVMLSYLGHEVLAASALISSTQISIMVTGMGVLFSVSILTGHALGEKDYLKAGVLVRQGVLFALLISALVIFLFWNVGSILSFFGQSKNIVEKVEVYFHAYVFGAPAHFLNVCFQQFCFAIQKRKLVFIQALIGMGTLLGVGYILIFGKFGIPAMEIKGYGYAMSIAGWVSFFFMLSNFIFDKSFRSYRLFHFSHFWNKKYFMKMFYVGGHISLQMSAEMASLFLFAAMVGWVGSNALAAYQIVIQYIILSVVPIFATSQASAILIGQACGAKAFTQLRVLSKQSIKVVLTISGFTALLFLLIPEYLAKLFLDASDPENAVTLKLAILLFMITAFSQVFTAVKQNLTGLLRGILDSKYPMIVGNSVIWGIGIPLAYVFAFVFDWGVVGVILGSASGMLVGACILILRWLKKVKELK